MVDMLEFNHDGILTFSIVALIFILLMVGSILSFVSPLTGFATFIISIITGLPFMTSGQYVDGYMLSDSTGNIITIVQYNSALQFIMVILVLVNISCVVIGSLREIL